MRSRDEWSGRAGCQCGFDLREHNIEDRLFCKPAEHRLGRIKSSVLEVLVHRRAASAVVEIGAGLFAELDASTDVALDRLELFARSCGLKRVRLHVPKNKIPVRAIRWRISIWNESNLQRCNGLGALSKAQAIQRMPDERQIASLLAFARVYESVAQAVELLHQFIGTKLLRAEHTGERERLRTLRDLDASALRLRKMIKSLSILAIGGIFAGRAFAGRGDTYVDCLRPVSRRPAPRRKPDTSRSLTHS